MFPGLGSITFPTTRFTEYENRRFFSFSLSLFYLSVAWSGVQAFFSTPRFALSNTVRTIVNHKEYALVVSFALAYRTRL